MSIFDENGLVLDRYDEVKAALDQELKDTFGDGIRTDADSVLGQISAIISERVADQNELVQAVADVFNPSAAQGVFLSQLVQLNGIERKEPVFSTVALELTANSAGSFIPAGSRVQDPLVKEPFETDTDTTLAPFEVKTVSATAVNEGAIEAPSGTLTDIINPTFGWLSVDNPSDASVGALEESDSELRIRRNQASLQAGSASVTAIYSALLNIDEVARVTVLQNTSGEVDTNDIPPHSIWAVVLGGSDQDVAEALFNTVAAGIGFKGDTLVNYSDPVTGQTWPIRFDRPTEVQIYVTYVLNKSANYPVNGDDLIKQNTVDFFNGDFTIDGNPVSAFGLGDDVVASRLYTPANSIPGHEILDVFIGLSPSPTSSTTIELDPDQLAGTDTGKVEIS